MKGITMRTAVVVMAVFVFLSLSSCQTSHSYKGVFLGPGVAYSVTGELASLNDDTPLVLNDVGSTELIMPDGSWFKGTTRPIIINMNDTTGQRGPENAQQLRTAANVNAAGATTGSMEGDSTSTDTETPVIDE
jgi:hypothetical protein